MLNTIPSNPFPPSSDQMGSSGGGRHAVDYSTTEQNTGVKWIDSNDIYVKSFEFTSFSAGLNNLGALASDASEVIKFDGVFIKTINGTSYNLPLSRYDNSTNYNQVFIGDNIMCNIADGDFAISTYKLRLNVYYTKTAQ